MERDISSLPTDSTAFSDTSPTIKVCIRVGEANQPATVWNLMESGHVSRGQPDRSNPSEGARVDDAPTESLTVTMSGWRESADSCRMYQQPGPVQ